MPHGPGNLSVMLRAHIAEGENRIPRVVLKYVPHTRIHCHHHHHPKVLVKKYISEALRKMFRSLSLLLSFLDTYSQGVSEVCKDKSIEITL